VIPRYRVLERRILQELGELDQTEATIQRHWQRALSTERDQDAYVNSVALNLHSWYSGLERIFELVAIELEEGKLGGPDWHAELLRQMSLDLGDTRPPVLTRETVTELDEYRKFRHRIRSIYATHLDPERMESLVNRLPRVWRQTRHEIESFTDLLAKLALADEA
jgi:hypothetical protein